MRRTSQPDRMPLHGYQPILIDANVLTPEERIECAQRAMAKENMSWREQLTSAELAELDRQVAELNARQGRMTETTKEELCAIYSRAARTAEARLLFNSGRPVWYGDGVPQAPKPAGAKKRELPLGVTLGFTAGWTSAKQT